MIYTRKFCQESVYIYILNTLEKRNIVLVGPNIPILFGAGGSIVEATQAVKEWQGDDLDAQLLDAVSSE